MSTIPTPQREQVAGEVRALMGRGRNRRRVSQSQLAAALNIAQTSLSRRLTAEVPFDVDELAKVADFFGVEVSELFGRRPSSVWGTEDEGGQAEAA